MVIYILFENIDNCYWYKAIDSDTTLEEAKKKAELIVTNEPNRVIEIWKCKMDEDDVKLSGKFLMSIIA